MVLTGFSLAAVLVVSTAAAVSAALFFSVQLGPESRRSQRAANAADRKESGAVLLFENCELIDATRAGERLLAAAPVEGNDWSRLVQLLSHDFPDLEERLGHLPEDILQTYRSTDATTELTAEWRGGMRRISLVEQDPGGSDSGIDAQSLGALEREVETLRANVSAAPCVAWRQDKNNRVVWMNQGYLSALKRSRGPKAAQQWPTPALFDAIAVAENAGRGKPLRAAVQSGEREDWYDVYSTAHEDDLICTAIDVGKMVASERQLRSFTQTLTKTFADLAVGLAIFDRARRLVIFNPALADITELPFGFLAAHPTLFGFLDRLRDLGRMPEPRNYAEWRGRITDLEHSASDGNFCETWTLPNGQTIRVTGQPHPDGAVALIFEDISAEISLTRRFRAELEVGRSVFDHFDEAIAVFSPNGVLTMANSAYEALWSHAPQAGLDEVTVTEISEVWKEKCLPSKVWEQSEVFIRSAGTRRPWTTEVTMRDGRAVTCRFVPINGGATMIGFSPHVATAGALQFKRRAS